MRGRGGIGIRVKKNFLQGRQGNFRHNDGSDFGDFGSWQHGHGLCQKDRFCGDDTHRMEWDYFLGSLSGY